MKMLATVITCAAVVTVAKLGGHWVGTQSVRNDIAAESQANGSPAGVFGTTWLMSQAQVKQIVPGAVVSGENELLELRNVYGRNTKVKYVFENGLLVGVVATFTDESSRAAYDETQQILADQFGSLSSPELAGDGRLVSNHFAGRFAVTHVLCNVMGIQMEQVLYYLTRG